MTDRSTVDAALLHWGERLFYPSNRIVKTAPLPRLLTLQRRKAAVIRRRIVATVSGRAPQVMVKVTGGGRGMSAIAAHFRYISKNGRLGIEDDRGAVRDGKEALHDLVDQWRYGGSLIDDVGHRREAFNIMLSMPAGTDAMFVQKAAREFAHTELAGHRYVMVLHEHQANPHVHLSVRAEGTNGQRLNPRKTDLHRWRETFAEKLRGWGIEAEASRQATRGQTRNHDALWRVKARHEGRLHVEGRPVKSGQAQWDSRAKAMQGWAHITQALAASDSPEDRQLAEQVARFMMNVPFLPEQLRQRLRDQSRAPSTTSTPMPERRPPGPPRPLQPGREQRGPEPER